MYLIIKQVGSVLIYQAYTSKAVYSRQEFKNYVKDEEGQDGEADSSSHYKVTSSIIVKISRIKTR